MKIRKFVDEDWDQVKEIYQLGIDIGVATFETSPPEDLVSWNKKIQRELTYVYEEDEKIFGWVTLSKVSKRSVYEGVGEISIYIHPNHKRKKIGKQLYTHFEQHARDLGYWTIQAQLFTENEASKLFFESQGFRQVGIREKIGQLNGKWTDNYLYEKNFN